MAKTWVVVLTENAAAWEFLLPEITILKGYADKAQAALDVAQGENKGPVAAEAARVAFAKLKEYMRFLKERKMFIPPISLPGWVALGLKVPDGTRTPHIDVKEDVEFEIRLNSIRELVINFWVKGEAHRAKPNGYDGAVIIWGILEEPPESVHDLILHSMASRTPYPLEFTEQERGKTAYIALAWQNDRGLIGKWSEIQSAIVP
jgi:hypothetical protein